MASTHGDCELPEPRSNVGDRLMTDVTANIVVPIATEDDAEETARILSDYEFGTITAVHVIEHVEGAPDPISPEQAELEAQNAFAAFRSVLPEAEVERVYRNDVLQGILDVAADKDATAIVFRPRGGSRLMRLLSGDVTDRLVTETDRPVISLPEPTER